MTVEPAVARSTPTVAPPPLAPSDDRRSLIHLSAAAIVAYASYALCRTPLLPLFAQHLGAGPEVVGLVVAASTITGVFVKLPAGALSDVLGRRPLLLAGAFVFAVLPFSYLAIVSITGLIAVRVVHGHATAIFGPVASAAVSDLAPPDRRGRWLGTYATAQAAGQALAPVLAGYLIAVGGFDLAFVVAGVLGLAAPALVASVPIGQAAPVAAAGRRWKEFRTGIRDVLGARLVLIASAAQAVQFMLNGVVTAFLPLYAKDAVGLAPADIGWLFAVQTLAVLGARPVVGALSDRLGRRAAIASGLMLCGGALWAVSMADDGPTLAMCVIGYGLGVASTSAATSAFITDVTPRERYGAAHGVFGTIYDIGDALGPIGAGVLVGALGYESTFRLAAIVGVATAVVFALSPAALTRRPQQNAAVR